MRNHGCPVCGTRAGWRRLLAGPLTQEPWICSGCGSALGLEPARMWVGGVLVTLAAALSTPGIMYWGVPAWAALGTFLLAVVVATAILRVRVLQRAD